MMNWADYIHNVIKQYVDANTEELSDEALGILGCLEDELLDYVRNSTDGYDDKVEYVEKRIRELVFVLE